MFDLKLKPARRAAGALTFSVPASTRLVFGGIALAVAGSAVVSAGSAGADAANLSGLAAALGGPGLAVLAVAALAALYEERWTFDPAARAATFRFGLVFLAKRRTIDFAALETVEVETFVKGIRPGAETESETEDVPESRGLRRLFRKKRYASLAIYTTDAERLVVDTVPAAGGPLLEEAAEEIRRMLARG